MLPASATRSLESSAMPNPRPHRLLPWVLCGLGGLQLAWSLLRHRHFGSNAADLGAYESVFWSLGQRGELNNSVERIHQWSAHLEVGLLPLWLPYRLYPSVVWLFALQAACCAGAGFYFERFARRALRDARAALLCTAAMLLSGQLVFAQINDFHSITLCALPVAMMICAVAEDRWGLLLAGALLALSLREQMGLAVAGAAIAWVLVQGRARAPAAAALGTFGLCLFAAEVQWLIPRFQGGGSFRYLDQYQRVGGSLGAAMRLSLAHPLRLLSLLVEGERPLYLLELTHAGLALLALTLLAPLRLAWPLLLGAPLLLVQLLSAKPQVWDTNHQYGAPVVPALAAATVLGLSLVYQRWPAWGPRGLALWCAGTLALLLPGAWDRATRASGPLDLSFAGSPRARALHQALALIPPDAPVSAQDRLVPHLADRRVIHLWPDGEATDALVMLDTFGVADNLAGESQREAAVRLRGDARFEVALDVAGVLLLRRRVGAGAP